MISIDKVHRMAIAFPDTDEHPHYDHKAFRVKKKIFAALSESEKKLILILSLADQSVFCALDQTIIYPISGGWGKMGFTTVNLREVKKSMLNDAITEANCNVVPRNLAEKYFSQ